MKLEGELEAFQYHRSESDHPRKRTLREFEASREYDAICKAIEHLPYDQIAAVVAVSEQTNLKLTTMLEELIKKANIAGNKDELV